MAAHRDELKGLHVNTHIPQVIAAARLYELTGDKYYWNIADYFWNEVTTERSYCTGGTSNFETWRTEPGVLSTQLSPHTAEDCCAYNMMKLTRHLFGWSPQARYMDYYERTLFNHRMGTIDPETGTTAYYLRSGAVIPKYTRSHSTPSGAAMEPPRKNSQSSPTLSTFTRTIRYSSICTSHRKWTGRKKASALLNRPLSRKNKGLL